MYIYAKRGESHYREVLSEAVNDLYDYYRHKSAAISDCEGYSDLKLDLRDYICIEFLFADFFTLEITEEMPDCKEPDVLFGKGNEYVCCKVDPGSHVGKTICVREQDYVMPFLIMFAEKYNNSDMDFKVEYKVFSNRCSCSYPSYIRFKFYAFTN